MTATLLKNVIVIAHSEMRGIMVGLARKFREQGSNVTFICSTRQECDFYSSRFGDAFNRIVTANGFYAEAMKPVRDEAVVVAKAVETEAWLGTNINRLVVYDRHFGKGFAPGGTRHPRSIMSEYTSYPQMLQAYITEIEACRKLIEDTDPDLIVGDYRILEAVAGRIGVPIRNLVSSRYKNFFYWSDSMLRTSPAIEAAFSAMPSKIAPVEMNTPYNAHMDYREKFLRDTSLVGVARRMGYTVTQQIYWILRRYEKRIGYFLWDRVAYFWHKRADLIKLRPPVTKSLAEMAGQKFVFFPLHTEPETALQGMSPEFLFQLEAITAIARDLPADVKLVVKEAYHALGRRPRDFHRQIMAFKNVVMLETMELGLDVVKEAAVTLTITGTAGYEAAVLGKPVISFGRHNIFGFLDHVHVVQDLGDLRPVLAECLSPSFDHEKARADGARFLNAMLSISIDLGKFNTLKSDEIAPETVDEIFAGLQVSLESGKDKAA